MTSRPRFRNKLEAGRDQAYLSQKLAAINTQVPIAFDLEACRAQAYNRDKVADLFRELEFRTLMDRIPSGSSDARQMDLFVSETAPEVATTDRIIVVDDTHKLEALVKTLKAAKHIAFDVETTSTDPILATLVGISLAVDEATGYYIPVGHNASVAGGPQLGLDQVLVALGGPMTDPDIPKLGHNVKYDAIMLTRHGLAPRPLAFDTMVAEWLCDPASRNLGLKNLAWVRLGLEMTEISRPHRQWAKPAHDGRSPHRRCRTLCWSGRRRLRALDAPAPRRDGRQAPVRTVRQPRNAAWCPFWPTWRWKALGWIGHSCPSFRRSSPLGWTRFNLRSFRLSGTSSI